eukprot:CAMPEP_0194261516 /NCGR_PEP_ID=MMETSP0158-20130606/46068_1 /TAXON_ID=33649 /ORGANISM="Thalassionema nitzschioides, Strain L26-B" /LENGTH=294 /DNA_ID=CAMNT_0039001639 /DNA_START=142 /DNA_END=1026 /DNA_ORIENTATION=-
MLLQRLLTLAQKHVNYRGRGVEFTKIALDDMIQSAKAFGFEHLPHHDQLFEFFDLRGNRHFLTALEISEMVYDQNTEPSLSEIRECFEIVFEHLLEDDSEVGTSLHYDFLREEKLEELMDSMGDIDMEDDGIDIEEWLESGMDLEKTLEEKLAEYNETHMVPAEELINMEIGSLRDGLTTFRASLVSIAKNNFGLYEPKPRLSASLFRKCYSNGLSMSKSAASFLQLLIEEVHYGIALEAKVKIQGSFEETRDYGILIGRNGTIWKSFLFTDYEILPEDEGSDDEDYDPNEMHT